MSYRLTASQAAARDAALVTNLRNQFPQISNYSDDVIVRAYESWFSVDDSGDEAGFIEFIDAE